MTPQAGLPPAFPVNLLCSWPPLPKSSVPECTTIVRWGYTQHTHFYLANSFFSSRKKERKKENEDFLMGRRDWGGVGGKKGCWVGSTYTQNTGWSNKLDALIRNRSLRIPIAVCIEVSQIPYMTLFITGRPMRFGKGIDYCRGGIMPLLASIFYYYLSLCIRKRREEEER